MKRALLILIGCLVGFLALDAAVFHTSLYPYWVATSSSTGYVETVLYHERIREKQGPNQILGIGDSRMALVPKVANAMTPETGITFGTISVAGTTPRCWYYMLRSADPTAKAYKAIVIGIESYNDDETPEDYSERESDLNYVIHQLRLSDLEEFSTSYRDPERQKRAALGIAFKGTVYKRDLQDFLLHPVERVKSVRLSWRDSKIWFYDFRTDEKTLNGLTVDWEHRTLNGAPAGVEPGLRRIMIEPLPKDQGRRSAYMTYWLGKIAKHYEGSPTKLVFMRLPRAPWIRPDLPPTNPKASVRVLKKQQDNVVLLPENMFNELETPALFHDEVHLNQIGMDKFTEILARQMRDVLGPAH